MSDRPEFLTTAEVAKILRYKTHQHVANLCKAGKLPAVCIVGKWLIPRKELEALLNQRHQPETKKVTRNRTYVTTGITEQIKAMK